MKGQIQIEALNKTKKRVPAWYFEDKPEGHQVEDFVLIPARAQDFEKVQEFYRHHPVAGYDIGRVDIIYNPHLNRSFSLSMRLLQAREGNPAFAPRWSQESDAHWRKEIDKKWQAMAAPYRDEDYPNVKIMPLWHGTKPERLKSVFQSGYANLATTDSGFFGKGMYSTHEAEYAWRVYARGALLLNWVATYSAYPTIKEDVPNLSGKGNYQNYDAHFVPIVPANRNNPSETCYYPTVPGQVHRYIEVVVFEKAQCLPRYLVTLQATLFRSPSAVPSKKELSPSSLPGTIVPNKAPQSVASGVSEVEILEQVLSISSVTKESKQPSYNPNGEEVDYRTFLKSLETNNLEKPTQEPSYNPNGEEVDYRTSLESPQELNQRGEQAYHAKNYLAAVDYFKKASTYVDAQFNLGLCFYLGQGVLQDYKMAEMWYLKASEQGNVDAQNNLGRMYKFGDKAGVGKDSKKAFSYFEQAAKRGYAPAQYNLAVCYQNADGVNQNYQLALYWYQEAARQGQMDAQYWLGMCYEKAYGLPRPDFKKAIELYGDLDKKGYSLAKQRMARLREKATQADAEGRCIKEALKEVGIIL